jgi:hypothetical protein
VGHNWKVKDRMGRSGKWLEGKGAYEEEGHDWQVQDRIGLDGKGPDRKEWDMTGR